MNENAAEITQTVQIAVPAARVFAALLDPDERRRWWSREGRFVVTSMTSDPRPGGLWRMDFLSQGRASCITGQYLAIAPPHRLEFTWRPSWYENPSESVVCFELEESNGVTTVRLRHSGLITAADRDNHHGWPDILAMLRAYAEKPAGSAR